MILFYPTPYNACFEEAAQYYKEPAALLKAIAYVESGYKPYAIDHDANGTTDYGVMQVNTSVVEDLRRLGLKISYEDLYNPCYNIFVGAYDLRRCINVFGLTWKAVDCYNKGPGHAHNTSRYVWMVYRRVVQMYGNYSLLFK